MGRLVAMYDFAATDARELSFRRGDVLTAVERAPGKQEEQQHA